VPFWPGAPCVRAARRFLAKAGCFLFLFLWVRWTLPRFRFDQLMRLGWKVMLPLALANVFVTGLVVFPRLNRQRPSMVIVKRKELSLAERLYCRRSRALSPQPCARSSSPRSRASTRRSRCRRPP